MEELITQENILEITNGVIDNFLKPHFIEKGLSASGSTVDSMTARTEINKGIISANASIGAALYGRGPNKDQNDEAVNNWVKWFAPNVFQPWMNIRGLSGSPYALAHTIAREGSRRFRENDPSDFLEILKTEEVRQYLKSKLSIFVKANLQVVLKDSIEKLKNA